MFGKEAMNIIKCFLTGIFVTITCIFLLSYTSFMYVCLLETIPTAIQLFSCVVIRLTYTEVRQHLLIYSVARTVQYI